MRFRPNQQVGRFKIEKPLDPGGFGEAYLALDVPLERRVVIKCVRSDLDNIRGVTSKVANEFRNRFWLEARGQARISHPNVCTVFEVDRKEGLLVLEYIEGRTLEVVRETGELSRQDLLDCVIGIAEAIAAAHAKNVIHRDLTMKNVMLTASKRIKVLDFGLVKLWDEPQFTMFADSFGTPGYMSPEQHLRPRDVDKRTDIFSLGVLIYRLVTHQFPYVKPFQDDEAPDTPPSFSDWGFEAWPELNVHVRTALEPKPEDRFPDMAAMLQALCYVRDSLNRTSRSLHCFDSSTLFEVVCPPVPTSAGKERSRRARDQFLVHHAENRAVTSPAILAELLAQVSKLYFDAKERGLRRRPDVQSLVAGVKDEIRHLRQDAGPPDWDRLTSDERLCFLRRANTLFLPKLKAMVLQLSPVIWHAGAYVRCLADFAGGLGLPERDARVLAEVFSVDSEWLFSEESRYGGRKYRTLLERKGPNRYRILRDIPERDGAETIALAASKRPPRKRQPAVASRTTQSLPH